jgi:hypothetical protein
MAERPLARYLCAALATATCHATTAQAQSGPTPPVGSSIQLGAVLDGSFVSRALALGSREEGFGLGHNELTLGAAVDDLWTGRATVVAHRHDGELEFDLEEAFVETVSLPAGLQFRGGRFLSQVGYLNEQHTHTDDFIERPLLYRAFLGSHYLDDGVRLNWVAPTRLYWRSGIEVFSGKQLIQEAEDGSRAGVWALNTRVGGDVGVEHSWQLGMSYLRNRLSAAGEAHDDHDHDDDHGHDHEHAGHVHGASYSGGKMLIADAVWKWAPNGNNRQRQLRLSAEYARVEDINEHSSSGESHRAWYLSAVYRFAPEWEAGVRVDDLQVQEPHGDHFHAGRLKENTVSLTWKRSHFSALRLQWTGQRDRGGFDNAVRSSVQLQYVMNLGAHGAHSF